MHPYLGKEGYTEPRILASYSIVHLQYIRVGKYCIAYEPFAEGDVEEGGGRLIHTL